MQVKSDLIRIQSSDYDESGNKLEPEEKPAERILAVDAPVTGSLDGKSLGSLQASVTVQSTVIELAQKLRTQCAGCKHFDQRAFQDFKGRAERSISKEPRRYLNAIRAGLLETGLADFIEENPLHPADVEMQLNAMGVCRALTEVRKDLMFVHPESSCPDEYRSESLPDGYFEPHSIETQKVGDRAFDQIMHRATS